jgi:hypothetical protein
MIKQTEILQEHYEKELSGMKSADTSVFKKWLTFESKMIILDK